MSVLVTDKNTGKSFVFIKGAPERLLEKCINIHEDNFSDPSSPQNQYSSMVKILSLSGLRTIAVGFREITNERDLK